MNKELKFIEIGVGHDYTTSRDGTCAIRTPLYHIEYEDENGDVQSGFHSHDLGDISKALIKHFGIRSAKEKEEMSNAYIPKKGRYDTVLSILKEQIDEYFKVDSDLDRITEITEWQSEDGINLSASVTRTLTMRRSQLVNGIYRNCQLIAMGEGRPVKEEENE